MSINQRVLFPVDLSSNIGMLSASTRAMFDRADVEIIMLHAIEEPSRTPRGTEIPRAVAQMEFLAQQSFDHARVTRRVERGRAVDCILDYAGSHSVDVIIMPAGSAESLRHRSLGRVTEDILANAPCAVWMEWMTGSVELASHICCTVNLDGADEPVLRRAAKIASEFGAQLTMIHAVVLEGASAPWWDTETVEQDLRLARMQMNELRRRFAPAARMHVEAGRSDSVISNLLHRMNAGLLVAARHGSALVSAALACPVLRLSPSGGAHRSYAGAMTGAAS
jgi:nucleotide-binding universal stress UspA family protein